MKYGDIEVQNKDTNAPESLVGPFLTGLDGRHNGFFCLMVVSPETMLVIPRWYEDIILFSEL